MVKKTSLIFRWLNTSEVKLKSCSHLNYKHRRCTKLQLCPFTLFWQTVELVVSHKPVGLCRFFGIIIYRLSHDEVTQRNKWTIYSAVVEQNAAFQMSLGLRLPQEQHPACRKCVSGNFKCSFERSSMKQSRTVASIQKAGWTEIKGSNISHIISHITCATQAKQLFK